MQEYTMFLMVVVVVVVRENGAAAAAAAEEIPLDAVLSKILPLYIHFTTKISFPTILEFNVCCCFSREEL